MGPTQVLIFRLMTYLALGVFAAGLGFRLVRLLRAPVPLKIPLATASTPHSWPGLGLLRDMGLVTRLRRVGIGLAGGVLVLHAALLLLLLAHLRFVLSPVPEWVVWLRAPAVWAGWGLALAGFGLLVRRLLLPPVLYLSRRQDFLILILLMALAVSGLFLKLVGRTDIFHVKQLIAGLWGGAPAAQPWPGPWFWVHYGLFLLLLVAFPFSNLFHGLGLVLNPVLRQRDDSLMRRKHNPWDKRLAGDRAGLAADGQAGPRPFSHQQYRDQLKRRWGERGVAQVLGAAERGAAPSHEGNTDA